MVRTLDLLVEHDQVKSESVPISLEALSSTGNAPSLITVHYVDKVYAKKKRGGKNYYLPTEEKTIVYEFDCRAPALKRMGRYKGNFKEKGFRWDERLLKEYFPRDSASSPLEKESRKSEKVSYLKRKQKRRAYRLVKRVIEQLKESRQGADKLKDKENYDFFIGILKKVNINPDQEGEQINLIG